MRGQTAVRARVGVALEPTITREPTLYLPAYLEVAADAAQHVHRRRVLACGDARVRARARARARVRVRVAVRVVLARVRVSWPAVMLPVSQVTTVRVSMAPSLSAW